MPPKDEVVIQDCVEFFLRNSFSFSFKVWRIFSTISDGLLLELPVRIPNDMSEANSLHCLVIPCSRRSLIQIDLLGPPALL